MYADYQKSCIGTVRFRHLKPRKASPVKSVNTIKPVRR